MRKNIILCLLTTFVITTSCQIKLDNPGNPGDKSFYATEALRCLVGQLFSCRLGASIGNESGTNNSAASNSNVSPSGLSYDTPLVFYSQVSNSFIPRVSGTSLTFSISPSLPSGINLDSTSGVISGSYSSYSGSSLDYAVTVSNAFGSTSTTIKLTAFGLSPLKTGQTTCMDNLANPIACSGTGQDAEFQKGSNPSLTDNADATVKDNHTGLTWKKCELGGVYTVGSNTCTSAGTVSSYIAAATNCAVSSGFRVPTVYEIRSISKLDNTAGFYSPFIIEGFNYWTSTPSPIGHFIEINTDVRFAESLDANSNITKCVSGNTLNSKSSFVDNADGTILDIGTGLLWQKCPIGQSYSSGSCIGAITKVTWDISLTNCTSSNLKGKAWRLPNMNELASIFDPTYSNYVNPTFFPSVGDTAGTFGFWSSTGINTASRVIFFSANTPTLSTAPKSTNNAYASLCVTDP